MKSSRIITLFASTLIAFLSCNKESAFAPQMPEEKMLTIEAYYGEMETKNVLDVSGNVLWNPHDSISVFFGDYSVPFYAYNTKPATRANFVGTVLITTGSNAEYDENSEDYIYWGVYPYQTHHFKYIPSKYEGGVACFVDESQTATEDTFDRSTFVTVARSRDYSKLAFYNLCGGVRFKLSSSDIETVTFTGNNNEALAGEVVVDMDADGHPYARKHYSEIKTIRLSAPKGTTFKAGVWYYLVSLPSELSAGFTMKFISKSQSKMAVLKTNAPVSIERSHFGSLDCPDANLEYTQYDGSEEKAQLRVELYIKSVKMAEDESFSVELGFPTIAAQKVCEKVEFKVNYFTDLNNPNSIPQKIGSTLYCVGIGYDRINYNKYDKLSVDEQILFNNLRQHRPSKVFYSSKSRTFISVDQSDKNMYNMAHSIFGRYLGSCDNNNYFHLPPVNGSGELLSEGNKIYNILDNEDKLVLQEWGDYSKYRPSQSYSFSSDNEKMWMIDGECPAYLSCDKKELAVFPKKGVSRSLDLSEYNRSFSLKQVEDATFAIASKKYPDDASYTAVRFYMENGYPKTEKAVIGMSLRDISPDGSKSVFLCEDFSKLLDFKKYVKLNPDGTMETKLTLPEDRTSRGFICAAFSAKKDNVIYAFYNVDDNSKLEVFRHNFDTGVTTFLSYKVPYDLVSPTSLEFKAPLLYGEGIYDVDGSTMLYVEVQYLYSGVYNGVYTIAVNCDGLMNSSSVNMTKGSRPESGVKLN